MIDTIQYIMMSQIAFFDLNFLRKSKNIASGK